MKKLRKWINLWGEIQVVYVSESTYSNCYRWEKSDLPKDIFFDTKIECLNSILKVLESKLTDIKHQIKTYDKNEK